MWCEREIIVARSLNSEHWVSESESEWLEIDVHSVSSVTTTQVRPSLVGDVERRTGVMAMTHQCWTKFVWRYECEWIKDTKGFDKWTSEATGNIAVRYRKNCLDSATFEIF